MHVTANQDLERDVPEAGKPKRRTAATKAAQTLTLLPSVGSPDQKLAIKLMAPVILSIWEKHRLAGDLAERIEEA